MSRTGLRPDLPKLPDRMRARPLDARGYPVPWFVEWIDGVPDFRVVDSKKLVAAMNLRLCWVCGEPLGRFGAFTIGPMCALNRTTSEPPSHRDCAIFSAKACPFLTRPKAERRDANRPEGWTPPAGVMIERNPGVALVWVTREWHPFPAEGGFLIHIGDPSETLWFSEGRPATRTECTESIETGLPLLLADTAKQAPHELHDAAAYLVTALEKARGYLPLGMGPVTDRPAIMVVGEAMMTALQETAP